MATPVESITPEWAKYFTEREEQEINFAYLYAREFRHGTDGHNAKIIIAKMVELLNANKIEYFPPVDFNFSKGK